MRQRGAGPRRGRLRPSGKTLGFGLVGLAFLAASLVCGAKAVEASQRSDAYAHSGPCPPAAAVPWDSDCLQHVPATVTDTVEIGGKHPRYELDVVTAADEAYQVLFPHSNQMVHVDVNGDAVTLTVWRGEIVAVSGQGTEATTEALPVRRFHSMLGGMLILLGLAMFLLPLTVFFVVADFGLPPLRGKGTTAASASVFVGCALLVGGIGIASGVAMPVAVPVIAVLVALALLGAAKVARLQKRSMTVEYWEKRPTGKARRQRGVVPSPVPSPVPSRVSPPGPRGRPTLRGILSMAQLVLGVGLLFLIPADVAQCLPGRAHDHAPYCPGGVVAASCRAETTLTVHGVRTSTAELIVVFNGPDGRALVSALGVEDDAMLQAVEAASYQAAPVPVELWHGRVWRAEFAGHWRLADGEPRYETAATIALSVGGGLFLILSRVMVRRRARGRVSPARLLAEDLGQALVFAGAVAALETGSWWGLVLLAGFLGWLFFSYYSIGRQIVLPGTSRRTL